MTLWRLEWLRLTRTWRGLGLLGIFLLFGIVGPLTARYLGEILQRLSTDNVQVQLTHPKPVDGILQFAANAQQVGLLATIIMVISALGFDALKPDFATFLRTRTSVSKLILIRFAVYAGLVSSAFLLGGVVAWIETDIHRTAAGGSDGDRPGTRVDLLRFRRRYDSAGGGADAGNGGRRRDGLRAGGSAGVSGRHSARQRLAPIRPRHRAYRHP